MVHTVSIALDQLRILRGTGGMKGQALTVLPDEEGRICIRLEHDAASSKQAGWTKQHYLVLDMQAEMDAMAVINLEFYRARGQEDGNHTISYQMVPTKRVKLAVKLEELDSRRLFLPTLPGSFKGHSRGRPADVADMGAMEIHVSPGYSQTFKYFTLFGVYLLDALPDMTVTGEPMVDEFGQWIQKDWSTKTRSMQELSEYLKAEYQRALVDADYPQQWSRYGGYTALKFDKTGFFHTHHDGDRWWLVDPDGYAFFSNGICYGTRMGVFGFVDRMEALYSWLPDRDDPTYQEAWTTADHIAEFVKRNGAEAGRDRLMFNFARANMIRVFGKDRWWDAWVTINTARMKRWGFNTVGVGVNNYTDERVMDFLDRAKIPFVWTLKEFPLTDQMVFRDFPDVFSPQYAEGAERFAREQLSPFVGNPYMIGYFVNNEPEWHSQRTVNIAERVFAHPERLASKGALIEILKRQYGAIETLNAAWGRSFDSFDSLYTPFEGGDAFTSQSARDFAELRAVLMRKYSQVVHQALRKVDPDHMNLGMRFAGIHAQDLPGCEYMDVFSYNRYAKTPVPSLDEVASVYSGPVVIGEWHIGGRDKGLLSHGLLAAQTQDERGIACEYYMQGAMAHPSCVGMHYFEMNDQPLLGRFDGENMQHGLIDVCNRSYDDCIAHLINTNRQLYQLVLGNVKPANQQVEVYNRSGMLLQ